VHWVSIFSITSLRQLIAFSTSAGIFVVDAASIFSAIDMVCGLQGSVVSRRPALEFGEVLPCLVVTCLENLAGPGWWGGPLSAKPSVMHQL
jgi:hypothetical protein